MEGFRGVLEGLEARLGEVAREAEYALEGARCFRPRFVDLREFTPLNDELVDRREEVEVDEVVLLRVDYPLEVVDRLEVGEDRGMVAVDASSFRVGEADEGVVAAYRVSVVSLEGDRYTSLRYGPLLFYITEENCCAIYNYFRGLLGVEEVSEDEVPSLFKMVDRVRNFLERLAQREVALRSEGCFLLWDGSLTAGTVDTPSRVVEETVEAALDRGNAVIGVSKSSSIKVGGRKLMDLLVEERKPCYVDLTDLLDEGYRRRVCGRVFAAKFSADGFTFRVDVASDRQPAEELAGFMALCPVYNGYPEPLRRAHINCYFTANEVLALQAYVAEKYGLTLLPPFDVRSFILYPF